jgi:hypothetical protein
MAQSAVWTPPEVLKWNSVPYGEEMSGKFLHMKNGTSFLYDFGGNVHRYTEEGIRQILDLQQKFSPVDECPASSVLYGGKILPFIRAIPDQVSIYYIYGSEPGTVQPLTKKQAEEYAVVPC